MCTALSLRTKDRYFGRTLDIPCSYGEEICILPRYFPIKFRQEENLPRHYAIIGMGTVKDGVALLYDGANEYGLCAAGLNFPENAHYEPVKPNKTNITPFELIPWILGKCKNISDVSRLIENLNLADIPFSDKLPLSPLHWIISDLNESLVIEPMKDGIHIHENPTGVLTNNPQFEYQLFNLSNYRNLSSYNFGGSFSEKLGLKPYCEGLGALGLPGDVSSLSRFVRTVFASVNSVCDSDEISSVTQFFHIFSSVEMCRGVCRTDSGDFEITTYSSCINANRGIYYYTTYENRQISCVDMHGTNLDDDALKRYPLIRQQQIYCHKAM